jgi:hypothetical protein
VLTAHCRGVAGRGRASAREEEAEGAEVIEGVLSKMHDAKRRFVDAD